MPVQKIYIKAFKKMKACYINF